MASTKSKIIKVMSYFGAYQLSRLITYKIPKILMYHRFSEQPRDGYIYKEIFDRHISYLVKYFTVIPLKDLAEYYHVNGRYPSNSVVITIDDGYRDFYDIAFPILKKYGVPATFFIATRFVDGGFWLWPDKLRYIIDNSENINGNLISDVIGSFEDKLDYQVRDVIWHKLVQYLLSIREDDKNRWIDSFAKMQNVILPDCPTEDYCAVTWSQVKEMNSSIIEIGAHSRTHPSLGRVSEGQLSEEVTGSVKDITDKLGYAPVSFCYPNGQPADYSDLTIKYVRDSGCKCAVTAFCDSYPNENIYELRRFGINNRWQQFANVVNGVEYLSTTLFETNTAKL